MKLTSLRIVLGACALHLTLLAGCVVIPGEPIDPPPVDPPPVDPPPPEDPAPVNAPADSYDIATNRVLISDCRSDSLLAMDAATGEISTLIPQVPGAGNDERYVCLGRPVVDPAGGIAYASFLYTIHNPDPTDGDGECTVQDLVSIDTTTGALTTLHTLWTLCDWYDADVSNYSALQIDAVHDRLLAIGTDCPDELCYSHLSALPLDGGPAQEVLPSSRDWCYPDLFDDCDTPDLIDTKQFAFDPAAADERVLMFATRVPEFQPVLASIDLATGETVETIPIENQWGDLTLHSWQGNISVAPDTGRVFLTMNARRADNAESWFVVLVDRYTGTQSVIYDGRQAPDGSQIVCPPDASLDRQGNRLLLVEQIDYRPTCPGHAFALDLTTGAFTRL